MHPAKTCRQPRLSTLYPCLLLTGLLLTGLLLAAVLAPAVQAAPGGYLQRVDITDRTPSPIPGQVLGPLVPSRWDERCIPVSFQINDSLDPIPNPHGPDFLTVQDAARSIRAAMETWNEIPTSYIELSLDGTVSRPGLRRFDFRNELTFQVPSMFDFIANARTMSLYEDSLLTAGMDLDSDGDSDVAAGISTCRDVDGDGDIEFPVGFYRAGTILDADLQFDSGDFRFTVDAAAADVDSVSVDLQGLATHELGHAHGLAHSMENLTDREDGTGATMFVEIPTEDPVAELAWRTLDEDDIATSSLAYPEGTAHHGAPPGAPAALQPGDMAFDQVYGLIVGSVVDGRTGRPILGAHVTARDARTGERVTSAYSGRGQLSVDPVTHEATYLEDPEDAILDGDFVLPVPRGRYVLHLEAVDGNPATPGQINEIVEIGAKLGQNTFNEELWNGQQEGAFERSPGDARSVVVRPGRIQSGIRLVTNRQFELMDFGKREFFGFSTAVPGTWYALRVPREEVLAALAEGRTIQGVLYETTQFEDVLSAVVVYDAAQLTTGRFLPDGRVRVDLDHPVVEEREFLAQENDFTPFWFRNPIGASRALEARLMRDPDLDVYLTLGISEDPFPGPITPKPPQVGLDAVPIPDGRAYVTYDEEDPFFLFVSQRLAMAFRYRFSLVFTALPSDEPPEVTSE